MTKVIIDLPNDLHRSIKSYAGANGETIKNFFICAAEEKLKYHNKAKSKKKIKDEFISEEEADEMLKPYLIRLIKRINEGKEKTCSWEEAKKELKNI